MTYFVSQNCHIKSILSGMEVVHMKTWLMQDRKLNSEYYIIVANYHKAYVVQLFNKYK